MYFKEGLIQSARAGCEEILRQNAARFRGNNCVYFKKSQQNYGAKFPQNAAGALNQCFPSTAGGNLGRKAVCWDLLVQLLRKD
ncbi:MAG: hypothetical protein HFF26_06580 [Oscillospiraceae bacterium]|nr:hypothetical protein [Oscillospiraceae bacterium]